MESRAHARSADPETSHEAAASIGDLKENQRAVMVVLRHLGVPVLDEELVKEYGRIRKAYRLPEQSESGIRSRRAELVRAGKLMEGQKKRMKTGGLGRTWSIAPDKEEV